MTKNAHRIESDSMGEIEVPADCYWGAQTQRSLVHFAIGGAPFVWQRPVVKAFGLVKAAAAQTNAELGLLNKELADAIVSAANEVSKGQWDAHFPLGVFQTGSGTHSNMNANEVIANRANEILGANLGSKSPVHPNDHVNMGQSSNDVFPSVMHIAVLDVFHDRLEEELSLFETELENKVEAFSAIVKSGRTHLQDAAPLTLGQEISGWLAQLRFAKAALISKLDALHALAIGGTAVGTGLNCHPDFASKVADTLYNLCVIPFTANTNKFFALSSHDPLVEFSASLRTLAVALLKIANDIRWLASGPRCGIGELILPKNEPGSSIMPGKVNPTQCEALSMVCAQVFGNDATVAFGGSQGNFQLNAYKPVILHNVMESTVLLADAMHAFNYGCLQGLKPNRERIDANLERNLMLVTALNRHIGYDKAAEIAKLAEAKNLSLKQAAIESGYVDAKEYDAWVDVLLMTKTSEN